MQSSTSQVHQIFVSLAVVAVLAVLEGVKIIKPDVLSVVIIRLVRPDTVTRVTGDYPDNRWAKCENDPLHQLCTTQTTHHTFRPFGWSDLIFAGGERRGWRKGGGAEMSIFTDEIISGEADNIRDIISGAISIFRSQRQQTQPTHVIKQHSRAYISLIDKNIDMRDLRVQWWRWLGDNSQQCGLTTR